MDEESKQRYRYEFPTPPPLKMNFAAEFTETNRVIQEMVQKLGEVQRSIWESISESLSSLRDVDWEEIERLHKEAAESLAQKGWTIPMNMATSDIIELSEIQDQNELDRIFQEFYKIEENYLYVKSAVLEHKLAQEWKELLIQCFDNYERENYLIAIPNLFIIIENIGHILISPRFQKYIDPKIKRKPALRNQYDKVKQEIEDDRTYIIYYVSVAEFFKSVFKGGNFDKNSTRLPIINRDWVLHGRDYPKNWKQVDALRLFNALQTIVELDFLLEGLEKEAADVELVK
ncbi:hypothetical protein [Bacillus thuringiensis]|uniref:hypothetical protein n=1 Tax=Bacillus thuringiensis TaxID=1428 RepID=UPI000BF30C62|nr:hypothetical protein [Bacillus thuringiensis]PEY74459.1 hypothetical protein CN355_07555 [Bacillus thuringiensis]